MTIFHSCQFHFDTQDIRVMGSTLSGGTSLSGIEDVIETSGGGYWVAEFAGADFGGPEDDERAKTLAWRALGVALSGGKPADVRFCDLHHQPVYGAATTGEDRYTSRGADAAVLAVINGQGGGLNATTLNIRIASERELIGGERFTLVHPTWGARAYEIGTVTPITGGKRISFHPPVRGGVAVGAVLDFDDVRCRMRRVSDPSNALSGGLYSAPSIAFQEDMRPPA